MMPPNISRSYPAIARYRPSISQLPNLITGVRFLCAPSLLWLAEHGYPRVFLGVLLFSFFSDAMDGFIARRLQLESELGAKLDSMADVVIYIAISIGAWWLWPDIVQREAPWVIAVIVSYTCPTLVGVIKFGQFTSYHTLGVKIAAALMGTTVVVLLSGGPAWPFHAATVVCVLAAIEEVAITLMLSKQRDNVTSLWHVLRARNKISSHV